MSAPSKAHRFQSVKIRSTQRLATGVERTITLCKVTNMMKLMERTFQAATQVKVLSPVKIQRDRGRRISCYGRRYEE